MTLRMIAESLEYYKSWEIVNSYGQKLMTVIFNYADPVDTIIWRFRPEFFEQQIKPLFNAAESKNKFPKEEKGVENGL
jgi:hypothetical protein